MTSFKKSKSGFVIGSVLCWCFLQLSLTLKAVGTVSERLCAEDVLVLLHYLSLSPCDATNETHVLLHNTTQVEGHCMISCYIEAEIHPWEQSFSCFNQQDNTEPDTKEKKAGYLYFSKGFCCVGQRHVYIKGNCDYSVYHTRNMQLGERCISNRQCHNPNFRLKCSMNRCSCVDGHIEYNDQCVQEPLFEQSISYGQKCLSSAQCRYYGGVCSHDQTCSCRSGHVYIKEENICNQVTNLLIGESCTSDRQCNGTENSMTCSEGVCVCNTGYIEFYKMCLKAGLTLGTQCKTSLQCTGTANASICAQERCACEPGFIQQEDYCERIKEQYGGTKYLQTESEKDEKVLGAAVGAGISGLIVGVLVGFVVMFLIQRRRSGQDNGDETPKRSLEVYETTLQSVSKQQTYEHFENVKQETVTVPNTDVSDKVYNVIEPRSTPILDQHDDGGVYNHLFEKHDETGGGNYDNPQNIRAAQYERKLTEDNKITASDDSLQVKREENTEQDNYFVLEKKFD